MVTWKAFGLALTLMVMTVVLASTFDVGVVPY